MKRVLVIAYLFPPILNSGTQRPLKFVKYLPQFGWEPIVLTADRLDGWPLDPHLLEEIPAGVRVVRVPLLNDRIGDLIGTIGITATNRRRISHAVSWRLRGWRSDPDLFTSWQPTAVRTAMSIFRETGFDAILATGYPWTSLLIGRDLSKKTLCPLIADFRDPWAADDLFSGNLPPDQKERTLLCERSVVQQASAVVSVSQTMTDQMRLAHPGVPAERFLTIHNGFDPPDLTASPPTPRSGKLRIVFTGVWKRDYGPDGLYQVVEHLASRRPELVANLEVIAAGFEPGEAERRGLSHIIHELGQIPHAAALGLMQSADALFFTTGGGSYQRHHIPGKLFEYLGSGRPIIAVADSEGESARLMARVGGAVVVGPTQLDELEQVIASACVTNSIPVSNRNAAVLGKFERSELTRVLAHTLDSATRSRLGFEILPIHESGENDFGRSRLRALK
jgi:glycosyltransferase involved in cell wall biosynthesis